MFVDRKIESFEAFAVGSGSGWGRTQGKQYEAGLSTRVDRVLGRAL